MPWTVAMLRFAPTLQMMSLLAHEGRAIEVKMDQSEQTLQILVIHSWAILSYSNPHTYIATEATCSNALVRLGAVERLSLHLLPWYEGFHEGFHGHAMQAWVVTAAGVACDPWHKGSSH